MPKLVAAEIEHSLRRRIGSGEWSRTRRLPNERELAAEYNVARNTVRSAIDKIAADGSVTRQVGRGTFLREDDRLDFMSVIQKLTGLGQPGADFAVAGGAHEFIAIGTPNECCHIVRVSD